MGLMALIAEWEREMIAEQMGENKMILWRKGEINMGQEPFGYKWIKKKEELVIIEEEKQAYLRMVDLYLNHGLSMKDIALKLTEEGVKGKRGGSLRSKSVGDILKNPIFYGKRFQNQYEYEYDRKKGTHHRTRKLKPEEDRFILDAPAILDKSTWDKLQKKTISNRKKSKLTSPETKLSWLRDSLKCGICGAKVKPKIGKPTKKDGTKPRYYVCYWRGTSEKELKLEGRERCPLPRIKAEKLEKRVWWDLIEPMSMALNPQGLKRLIDVDVYEKQLALIDKQSKKLKEELKIKERTERRLLAEFDEDEFDRKAVAKKHRQTKEDIIRIESQLAGFYEKRAAVLFAKENDKKLLSLAEGEKGALKKLLQDIMKLPPADRQTLVEASIQERITIETDFAFTDEVGIGEEWRARWGENSRLNLKALKALIEKDILKIDSPRALSYHRLI
jgi:hypothetical protein